MVQKRMLMDKSVDGPQTSKRAKKGASENVVAIASPCRHRSSTDSADQSALVPVKRGGGRGLKAVQTSHEEEKSRSKANGEKEDSKTKVKEQKLFHAKTNAHVETKVVTEDSRKKVG